MLSVGTQAALLCVLALVGLDSRLGDAALEVVITGEGLERALTALNDAGIPTMGPAFTWRDGPSEAPTTGNLMFAVLDASAAGEAVARVSAVLEKEGGEYTVERGVAFDPEDWTKRRS